MLLGIHLQTTSALVFCYSLQRTTVHPCIKLFIWFLLYVQKGPRPGLPVYLQRTAVLISRFVYKGRLHSPCLLLFICKGHSPCVVVSILKGPLSLSLLFICKGRCPCLVLFICKGPLSLSRAIYLQRPLSLSKATHLQRTAVLVICFHLQRTAVLVLCH